MKLRERIKSGLQKVKDWKGFQRIRRSAPVRRLGQVAALCRGNPFPAQVVLVVIYRLALDILYLTTISPLYAYSGFTINMNPLRYAVSLLAVVAFAPFVALLNEERHPSAILVTLLNYLYFIPLTSYYGCKGAGSLFLVLALIYWGLLLFLQFHIPVLRLKPLSPKHIHPIVLFLTVLSCVFVLFISGRYTGFRLTLDFFNVYDIRAEASSYKIPSLFSYLLSFMPIILAVLLCYWLQRKRYAVVAALCVVYLFLYSIAAHKSVFFFLLLVLASYFLYRGWMLRWLPGWMAVLSGVAILEEKIIGTFYITTLFFRRMMYVPVSLAERYYTFFSENPLNLFRSGIMGKLSFENIYSIGIARLLGEYGGHPETNANNGLLGDLFANLPIPLGLVLMPLILVICFRLLDMVSDTLDTKLALPFCVFFASAFMNSSWSTALLSHGFLVACIMLYFFPKKEGILK